MDSVRTLIVGAGVTGLATAAALSERGDTDYLVLEADREIGGWCKTVKTKGFVWDYSGHFFHFKHPDIEQWLRDRMPGQSIRVVRKKTFIAYKGQRIDFPFQKNIHQLPQSEFIDCLYDLYFARSSDVTRDAAPKESNFKEMLRARFGQSICDKFLFPYNEKLYACDLAALDKDAMGRFFPYADLTDIVRNMKQPDNASYNATFTYPEGGAIEYVNAIASGVRKEAIALDEALVTVDLPRKTARTTRRELRFERMVSSAPFNRLAAICALDHDPSTWAWNKVLIFNFGFDAKGDRDVHWMYYPSRGTEFYRVGWYDNIFDTDRLSIYVEIGFPKDARIDVAAARERALLDLKREGVVAHQNLVAEHSVVLDPAYVHITQQSLREHKRLSARMSEHGVWSLGRYGGWTYCAIEDNIVEARALVASWQP
ncbi:MAG TPA: FAD-dependent oxidoreductase [Polyangiaceae bacterium]|jgi:protoporphyrinogen oxidase|nr:FAD-dependent oxidoreductase [Polyangiaceae bacterium]